MDGFDFIWKDGNCSFRDGLACGRVQLAVEETMHGPGVWRAALLEREIDFFSTEIEAKRAVEQAVIEGATRLPASEHAANCQMSPIGAAAND